MAATTLKAIHDRIETVLEATPFSLKQTKDAFNHDRQPNTLIDNSYRIDDSGLASTKSQTNQVATRIDRVTIFIARKKKFGGRVPLEQVEDQLVSIERYIKADGLAGSYHAELVGRKITASGEIVIASIDLTVDYDFSEAVA